MAYIALPYGYTLVADDLRQEVGGKISLIGMYGPELIFPPGTIFPVSLPKLAIAFHWFESLDEPGAKLEFRIYFPGDEQGQQTVVLPIPARVENLAGARAPEPDMRLVATMRPHFVLSPVTFVSAGLMKFRVHRNGEEWRIGALKIRVGEIPAPPTSASPYQNPPE